MKVWFFKAKHKQPVVIARLNYEQWAQSKEERHLLSQVDATGLTRLELGEQVDPSAELLLLATTAAAFHR